MKETEHSPFPTDETLAAYIDGRLDEETRRGVVEHMAECAECFDVVMGAREVGIVGEPRGRVVSWPVKAAIPLAVAAALAVVFITPIRERVWPRDDIQTLAAAAPKQRIGEGRIADFPYRERPQTLRGNTDKETNYELWPVALPIYEKADKHRSSSTLHARGIAQLLMADDGSVQSLEDAVKDDAHKPDIHSAIAASTNWKLLNDLAAGDIAAGHLDEAAEAVNRAWVLSHDPAVAWNRAVVAQQTNSPDAAARWNEYLQIDPSSQWAAEVRTRFKSTN